MNDENRRIIYVVPISPQAYALYWLLCRWKKALLVFLLVCAFPLVVGALASIPRPILKPVINTLHVPWDWKKWDRMQAQSKRDLEADIEWERKLNAEREANDRWYRGLGR